ncbi:hypothetical protein LEP1GSC195_2412 [Leptospira wolbachii serovar Codice str. CDC]|uniref:Uncharacterized protein n=1 Tax=Leptospira wolbachii serovar Codice str. CDC TaxID=1218599 RepID=R9A340_9LEPT|nr:hypothetical protein LEP1GSC195_2412 [Leptospira wolbachii serovar Codice str. CDC]
MRGRIFSSSIFGNMDGIYISSRKERNSIINYSQIRFSIL